mgnify:FL=1
MFSYDTSSSVLDRDFDDIEYFDVITFAKFKCLKIEDRIWGCNQSKAREPRKSKIKQKKYNPHYESLAVKEKKRRQELERRKAGGAVRGQTTYVWVSQ